jgi:FkbM family methyltransferase
MVRSILQSAGFQLRRCIRSLISYCLRLFGYATLIDQLGETFSRLQRLETTIAKEIERLDGYMVYHANSLSEQIDELNRISYLHANPDALLVTGRFDLLIPTAEAGLLSYITRYGIEAIEPGVRAVLESRLRSGGTVVDVGAGIGVHALTMAKIVGPGGRVVCIEPLPHIASTLERTLRLNGFGERSQVICCNPANSDGEAMLDRAQHSPMSTLSPITDKCTSLTATSIALDDHFAPGERVDLVKIDLKGAEHLVYKGMSRLLRENPEIELIVRWSASHFVRFNQSPGLFWESIRNDGFQPLRIDEERPGLLVALQGVATVPDTANILLTRKNELSGGLAFQG